MAYQKPPHQREIGKSVKVNCIYRYIGIFRKKYIYFKN